MFMKSSDTPRVIQVPTPDSVLMAEIDKEPKKARKIAKLLTWYASEVNIRTPSGAERYYSLKNSMEEFNSKHPDWYFSKRG